VPLRHLRADPQGHQVGRGRGAQGGAGEHRGVPGGATALNAYLRIAPDGSILIYNKSPEIGQGLLTAFPLIIAEELDADWSRVRCEQSPIDAALYGQQSARGSRSIPSNWDTLRRAGAAARAMLVGAAANEWGVAEGDCTTERSVLTHRASGRRLSYGELATKAAAMPLPDEKSLKLKDRKDYRLLGLRHTGVDNHTRSPWRATSGPSST
jgi:isoquinoline 1-oxidoreductase beta subunit